MSGDRLTRGDGFEGGVAKKICLGFSDGFAWFCVVLFFFSNGFSWFFMGFDYGLCLSQKSFGGKIN